MKAITRYLLLLVVLLAACAGPATEAAEPATQPASTAAPDASGSGTQVTIALADNTVTTSTTTFQVGVPYTFVITNEGRRAHNFNINPPASVAGSLQAALDNALLVVPQEQLSPGATVTVDFTFPDSAADQPLEFSCLIGKHYEDGMKVNIVVSR